MQKNMSGSLGGVIDDMLSGSVAGNIQFESSGGSTVTITPTLESGTKIADFSIDDVAGVLYAPTPEQPIEYTAGANIQISEENVISATDTTYTAGNNITIENGVISASGGSGINYSTNEQVIGTWIDGKPLYQKTIITNNSTINANVSISVNNLNIDTLVNICGNYKRIATWASLEFINNFNNYETNDYNSYLRYSITNNEIQYVISLGPNETTNYQMFTLQYTKSTD